MTNPYKRMYVLDEDDYKAFKQYKANLPTQQGATCSVDGKVFINENILAHHMKTHVNGFKCNICGKVFKQKRGLTLHLKTHPLQVQESDKSVLNDAPAQKSIPPTVIPKTHKQRSVLNFEAKQWLTLK
jgi:hypothetical protein